MYFKILGENNKVLEIFSGNIDDMLEAKSSMNRNEEIEEIDEIEFKELDRVMKKENETQTSTNMQYIQIPYQEPEDKVYTDLDIKLITLNFFRKRVDIPSTKQLDEIFNWIKSN